MPTTSSNLEDRVLVLAPFGRDDLVAGVVLREAGIVAERCADMEGLCAALADGAGAALVTEEALAPAGMQRLVEALGRQPPWSDFPVVVLTSGGETTATSLRTVKALGPANVTLLERPVRGITLVNAVQMALRARRRQYEIREHFEARERARRDAEQHAEVLRRLQAITDVVLAELPLQELLREVLPGVQRALEADTVALLLRTSGKQNEGEEVLHVRAALGLEENVGFRIPFGRGFAGRVAKERHTLVWDDVDYTQVVSPAIRRKGIRSLAGVPLVTADGLLGVLHVGSLRPRKFRPDEIQLLQLAGERIAVAIERTARRDAEHRERKRAEMENRAKDEFLAMLGHELRNPLSAVRNAIVTARLDESRRERALEIARRQTDQLGRLIDDLLDVARVTQGSITLRKEPIDLAGVFERAVEATRTLVEERGHTLSVSLPPDGVRVDADPVRLEQVVANLLTNAAKYTDTGGRIDLAAAREGEEAVIRVRDTGIGVPAEMLPRLFDVFMQGDRALDRRQGGLGIGLTLVHRLVELHGGHVEARSEGLGKGAELIVRLPALPPAREEPAPEPRAEPRHQGRTRVLLVEDNPDAAESLMMLLELLGHQVRMVHDGITAIDVAQANVPDVMLVDIGLPGIDGYEVARRVRAHRDLKHIVLVALTGYGQDEDRQRAFSAGFDYHLVKPVDPDSLQELVARLRKDEAEPEEPPTVH